MDDAGAVDRGECGGHADGQRRAGWTGSAGRWSATTVARLGPSTYSTTRYGCSWSGSASRTSAVQNGGTCLRALDLAAEPLPELGSSARSALMIFTATRRPSGVRAEVDRAHAALAEPPEQLVPAHPPRVAGPQRRAVHRLGSTGHALGHLRRFPSDRPGAEPGHPLRRVRPTTDRPRRRRPRCRPPPPACLRETSCATGMPPGPTRTVIRRSSRTVAATPRGSRGPGLDDQLDPVRRRQLSRRPQHSGAASPVNRAMIAHTGVRGGHRDSVTTVPGTRCGATGSPGRHDDAGPARPPGSARRGPPRDRW